MNEKMERLRAALKEVREAAWECRRETEMQEERYASYLSGALWIAIDTMRATALTAITIIDSLAKEVERIERKEKANA